MTPSPRNLAGARSVASAGLAAFAALALASGAGSPVRAQDSPGDGAAARDERADAEGARLVETLLGPDWKASEQAQKALEARGVSGARAALRARARTPLARDRQRLERVARDVVHALLADLERPFLETAPRATAVATLGDLGACVDPGNGGLDGEPVTPDRAEAAGAPGQDEPRTSFEAHRRAAVARAGLESLGPAALELAYEVPPVRSYACERALWFVSQSVVAAECARATKDARAFRESYRGRADIASVVLAAGLRSDDERVRTAFQAVRDDAVEHALADLESDDPERRETSHDELFRLGELAKYPLERIARGEDKRHASPEARLAAERLQHRIRFHLSSALVRKLGHELEGYESLPFAKRRSLAFELERLGGPDAVPTLRALLQVEPATEVQAVCAVGLFKQGDATGQAWLTLHGQKVNLIPKRDLANLILDQGNKYLQAKKFELAEKQYKQVLELEPHDSTALYNLACCYSLWGRTDEAVTYLGLAIDAGFDDVSHMDKDTDLDPIREDRRVKEMLDALRRKKAEKGEGQKPDEAPGDK